MSFLLSRSWIQKNTQLIGWVVIVVFLFFAARERFHLTPVSILTPETPVSILTPDSWGWLSPSLYWIGGKGFYEQTEREWLYSAFIAGCLRSTGSFAGYAHIQQVLGLLTAVLMWMTWRRWISFLPKSIIIESISTVIGLCIVAFYLFSPYYIFFELTIQPEAILPFFVFLQLFCILSFCQYRWQQVHPLKAIFFGAFSIFLAYTLFVLKPNWLLAALGTLCPIFLGFFGQKPPSLLSRFLGPLLGFVLIVTILWLPERILFVHTIKTRMVLPVTLFTIHADLIQRNLNQELMSSKISPHRRAFLQKFLPVFNRELEISRHEKNILKLLGFDPDYLMYRSSIFKFLVAEYQMTQEDMASFCMDSFRDVVISHPLTYIRKVVRQGSLFLFPDQKTFIRKSVDLQKCYLESLPRLPNDFCASFNSTTQSLYSAYTDSVKREAVQEHRIEAARWACSLIREARRIFFPLMVAFVILLLVSILWARLAFLRLPGLGASVIFAAPAGMALTIALVHALDNDRYRMVYGAILFFALGIFLIYVSVAITDIIRIIRTKQSIAKHL